MTAITVYETVPVNGADSIYPSKIDVRYEKLSDHLKIVNEWKTENSVVVKRSTTV